MAGYNSGHTTFMRTTKTMKLPTFERILREEDFAEKTIETYSYAVRDYLTRYKWNIRARDHLSQMPLTPDE